MRGPLVRNQEERFAVVRRHGYPSRHPVADIGSHANTTNADGFYVPRHDTARQRQSVHVQLESPVQFAAWTQRLADASSWTEGRAIACAAATLRRSASS